MKKGRETGTNRGLLSDSNVQEIDHQLDLLQEKFGLSKTEILDAIQARMQVRVPLSIFNSGLSALELVSIYLHEELDYNFKRIGEALNRSHKTIWNAYRNARKKHSSPLYLRHSKYDIPIDSMACRNLSMLECIVFHLKEKFNLSFAEIGRKLKRDQRTIWTVYHRAMKKVVEK